jgi:hypothetical protein
MFIMKLQALNVRIVQSGKPFLALIPNKDILVIIKLSHTDDVLCVILFFILNATACKTVIYQC